MLLLFLNQLANSYNKHVQEANRKILQENSFSRLNENDLRFLFSSAIGLVLDKISNIRNYKCIGEKTPENLRIIEEIHHILPSAKFIHVIRDGRDATISGWMQEKRKYPYQNLPLSEYVKENAKIWSTAICFAREFARKHPETYHEVRFEDLKGNPIEAIEKLIQFLNVDYSDDTIDLCLRNGSFKKLSGGRSPGQENRNSHFRKGISGDWKNHFDKKCLDLFMRHGAILLQELGYR